MAVKIALNHITHYQYSIPVELSPQIVRLRPQPHTRTPILSYSLSVTPKNHTLSWQQDPLNNFQARLVFEQPVSEFRIEANLVADLTPINPESFVTEEPGLICPLTYEPLLEKELAPFREKEPLTIALTALIYKAATEVHSCKPIDYLIQVANLVRKEIQHTTVYSKIRPTCEEVLIQKKGTCRDISWLLVQVLRYLGLAARVVCGYHIRLSKNGNRKDNANLASWVEVYLPGSGWIGVDSMSCKLTAESHIPLACKPEPTNATSVSGYRTVDREARLDCSMSITRL